MAFFDPVVDAIRSALRRVDEDPQSVPPYLDLIEAYQKCADQENEAELLEQAGFVIRDVRMLNLSEDEKRRLEDLVKRVEVTRKRLEK